MNPPIISQNLSSLLLNYKTLKLYRARNISQPSPSSIKNFQFFDNAFISIRCYLAYGFPMANFQTPSIVVTLNPITDSQKIPH